MHGGDVAFGLTTMGPAAEALAGESPLVPGVPMDNVCALFPMYETPFSIAALADSGIEPISDIPDGASIGFGPAASTSDTYFPAILEALGVEFDRRNGGWSDLGGQLQDGLIGVIAFAAGIPIPASTHETLEEDARAVSMWHFTIAGCDLSEDFVYEATKLSMENNDRMRDVHRSAATSIAENIKHNTVLPFHPGAVRGYEENSYEIPEDLKL